MSAIYNTVFACKYKIQHELYSICFQEREWSNCSQSENPRWDGYPLVKLIIWTCLAYTDRAWRVQYTYKGHSSRRAGKWNYNFGILTQKFQYKLGHLQKFCLHRTPCFCIVLLHTFPIFGPPTFWCWCQSALELVKGLKIRVSMFFEIKNTSNAFLRL